MKVEELKIGMMIRPKINKWTEKRMNLKVKEVLMENLDNTDDSSDVKEGFLCDITCSSPGGPHQQVHDIGIYVGVENSKYWMAGVKKHHKILIGNRLARLSGYDVRYLEPVK